MSFFGQPVSVRLRPSMLILVDRVVKTDPEVNSRADYFRCLAMKDLKQKFPIEFRLRGGNI